MTPLLQALTDATKAGFDAPLCSDCRGNAAWAGIDGEGWYECPACHATGLDASDPYGLAGRAHVWLETRACDVLHRWATNEVIVSWEVPTSTLPPGTTPPEHVERHNSTPESRATALLRLVARVGTPQETP